MGVSSKTGTVTFGAGPTTLCADDWELSDTPENLDVTTFCHATTVEAGHTAGKSGVAGPKDFSVTVSGPMLQNTSTGAIVTTFPTKGQVVNITLSNSGLTVPTVINRNFMVTKIERNLMVKGRYEYRLEAKSCV